MESLNLNELGITNLEQAEIKETEGGIMLLPIGMGDLQAFAIGFAQGFADGFREVKSVF